MPAIMTKLMAHWVKAVNEGYISLELAKEVVGVTESMMSSADGKPNTHDIFKPGTPFFYVFPKVHNLTRFFTRLQNIYITLQYKNYLSNRCTSPSRRLTKTRADDGNFWLI